MKLRRCINPLYQNIGDELKLGLLSSVEVIQTLWGGYGELVRLKFSSKTIIVKHVSLPKTSQHPLGWNTNRSHQRKLHSYQVEVNWYQNFSLPTDERCTIPKGLKCFQRENQWLIVMEDLSSIGFNVTTKVANKSHLQACLIWLGNFHARYMNCRSDLLWEMGTYWHLETRPDELEALSEQSLKNNAQVIDRALQQATYQTILHGDAKLANFCFNSEGTKAAAVDFQYVGHGCGMKDVALFMSSAVLPEFCQEKEEWILNTYFNALHEALKHYQQDINASDVEGEWRELFYVAWADFLRFLKGWSPNHWKINAYSEKAMEGGLYYLSKLHSK